MPIHQDPSYTDLPKKSAGKMLSKNIPVLPEGGTIADAESFLIHGAKNLASINYLYLIDADHRLTGVLSIREIFALPKNTLLKEVAIKELISVRPHTQRARVTALAIEHNLKEIPVVDNDNHILGAVLYDSILKTVREEHIEDSLQSAGIHSFEEPVTNIINASPWFLIRKRIPWLVIGVMGSAIAASIITIFQNSLEHQLLLAAFIPAVTYIAGAVGVQSETILIRTASLTKNFSFFSYVAREMLIGIGIASLLGVAIAGISLLLWHNSIISMILGLSFFIAIMGSIVIAVLLPWLLARLRLDPAITGGPLDTILSDIMSITVYFSIAQIMLRIFT